MSWLAGLVVVATGLWLVAMAVFATLAPRPAAEFLRRFANSARAHCTEQVLRILAGSALVVHADAMRYPEVFEVFGWILVATSCALLLVPWRWHQRFGQWATPLAIRHLALHALGSLLLGVFVLLSAWPAQQTPAHPHDPTATMAHQPGWIELYELLETGRTPPPELVAQCKASRTGLGETMLHWYAIEGRPEVLKQLIDLGFPVNVRNEFGKTPIMECALIGRWDNARVLFDNGADLSLRTTEGEDFYDVLDEPEQLGIGLDDRPAWTRRGSGR